MKYRKSTAVIAIVGILFSSAMGAKSASAETKTNSTAASASAPPSDLQALVGLQSPAEISAIQNSGPAELIYDTTAHKYVAAKKIQSIMTPNALQLVGPGCSTVSACMYVNGTTPNGYTGSGSLAGNWPGVTRVLAGDRASQFYYANNQYVVAATRGSNVYLTTAIISAH